MSFNRLLVFSLALATLALAGCKKARPPAPASHSAEALLLRLNDQAQLLNEALARKDYQYIHDYGSYFTSLAQALFSRLNNQQKQRLSGALEDLIDLSGQLDRAAGGGHPAATDATVQHLQAVLKDIEKQFREIKSTG